MKIENIKSFTDALNFADTVLISTNVCGAKLTSQISKTNFEHYLKLAPKTFIQWRVTGDRILFIYDDATLKGKH